jgi:hypothetical protein
MINASLFMPPIPCLSVARRRPGSRATLLPGWGRFHSGEAGCNPLYQSDTAIPILGVEAGETRAVEVEHADQAPSCTIGTTSSDAEALSQAMWPGKA